jgi:hypothetical protein
MKPKKIKPAEAIAIINQKGSITIKKEGLKALTSYIKGQKK